MEIGLFVLRLVVGGFLAGHGAQKLFGSFGGKGNDGTAQFFESIGMRPGRQNALAAGALEFVGGLLILFGLFTPLGALAITAVMTVAILSVHAKNGPWTTDGGYEYNLAIMAAVFALAGVGAGSISLDNAFGLDVSGTGWALAELAIGLLGGLGAFLAARRATVTDQATTRIAAEPPAPVTTPATAAGEARFERDTPVRSLDTDGARR